MNSIKSWTKEARLVRCLYFTTETQDTKKDLVGDLTLEDGKNI